MVRKSCGCLVVSLVGVLGVIAVGITLLVRPDIRFLTGHTLSRLTDGVDLSPVSYTADQLTPRALSELEADGAVTCDRSLLLVNGDHPVEASALPALGEYGDTGVWMACCAMDAYRALSEAVKEQTGQGLLISSSYRNASEQADVYAEDSSVAALPGESEHETGLALDVYVPLFAGDGFLKSEAGQFVNRDCWRYGFIIRYPLFKKGETGIRFEPWHLRYVGAPHAEVISRNGWTLEEYIERLQPGQYYEACGYVISRQAGQTLSIPNGLTELTVSPDNTGHTIVTGKLPAENG